MRSATGPRTGRPSKGDRWLVSSRLPLHLADRLRRQAEAEDIAYSDVVLNAVAAYYDEPRQVEPRVSVAVQERLIA